MIQGSWLFVRHQETIRIVRNGLRLVEQGPGTRQSERAFPDMVALVIAQCAREAELAHDGWSLEGFARERRSIKASRRDAFRLIQGRRRDDPVLT